MQTPIIAGNWKMNLGRVDEALAFVRHIRYQLALACYPLVIWIKEMIVATAILWGRKPAQSLRQNL